MFPSFWPARAFTKFCPNLFHAVEIGRSGEAVVKPTAAIPRPPERGSSSSFRFYELAPMRIAKHECCLHGEHSG
ncbi:hypothetical protein ALC62_02654 [Cyphomyrmex costatus]|uniref:Uncharacterized protein n=1 Tax=Cyphomyrmex costatus TaxID=456900 RepID=A0A195D0C0_9HYME|nr:hypothetical protein ALC62_02654 [Cyphomyrmex costatus]